MFEPIGGSAPKYTGKNVINPIAAIAGRPDDAGHPGRGQGGEVVENAIVRAVGRMKSMSAGQMGFSTSEVGDLVAAGL